ADDTRAGPAPVRRSSCWSPPSFGSTMARMKRWVASASLGALVALALVLSGEQPSHAGNDAALRARAAAASKAFALANPGFAAGMTTAEAVCAWSLRWYQAEKALGNGKAASEHLSRMQAIEGEVTAKSKAGAASALDAATAAYFRADAEVLAASP